MTVLLTGVNGFVGTRLANLLVQRGMQVVGFDVQPSPNDSESMAYVQGNLVDGSGMDKIPWNDLDAVVHLAAAGVKFGARDWGTCCSVNVLGTQRLLYCMAQAQDPPLLLTTTTFYERHLADEESPIAANPYVRSKALATDMIRLWVAQDARRKAILGTVFQAYGPGDAPQNVLTYAAGCFDRGETATFGSGDGLRDWIYVDDLVRAIAAALTTPAEGPVVEYDFGSGTTHSIKEMVLLLAELKGVGDGAVIFDPSRDRGDVHLKDKASKFVPGWNPETSIRAGLSEL